MKNSKLNLHFYLQWVLPWKILITVNHSIQISLGHGTDSTAVMCKCVCKWRSSTVNLTQSLWTMKTFRILSFSLSFFKKQNKKKNHDTWCEITVVQVKETPELKKNKVLMYCYSFVSFVSSRSCLLTRKQIFPPSYTVSAPVYFEYLQGLYLLTPDL